MYDFLIIGSGFFGSICARELTDNGFKCLVIEKRNHIGGNCYTENKDNINIHIYGPHIFHTSDVEVWNYINRFTTFNNFVYSPIANYKNELYSLPFNMWTFNKLWNITTPQEAIDIIENQSQNIDTPTNLEEQAIKLVGYDVYNKLIKGYTKKQWKKNPTQLPKEIIKRLPVRFTYDNNYFNDNFQGIPIGGYTKIFETLLIDIEVLLNTDYFHKKDYWDNLANKVIYTGPIDKFFNYKYGSLEYKTTNFENKKLNISNFQGVAVTNFTDEDIPYTRIIEHKHFERINSENTWITYEYPIDYISEKTEPYYPVNDKINNEKYEKYKKLVNNQNKVIFGGRLAEYKYYDMHQIIRNALDVVKTLIN